MGREDGHERGGPMGHRRDHEWLETFEGAGADRYDAHARRLRGLHERTARRVAELLPVGGGHVGDDHVLVTLSATF